MEGQYNFYNDFIIIMGVNATEQLSLNHVMVADLKHGGTTPCSSDVLKMSVKCLLCFHPHGNMAERGHCYLGYPAKWAKWLASVARSTFQESFPCYFS